MKIKDKSNSNTTKRIVDSFKGKKTNINHVISKSYSSDSITHKIFEYGTDKKIPFNLVRSKRRKTSELIIENENEITLRVPFDKPMEEITELIHKKIHWILKKQEELKRIKPEIKEYYSYLPYSTLPYLGNNYEVEIRNLYSSMANIEKVEIEDNKLIFYLKDTSKGKIADREFIMNKIKDLYEKWLYEQAQILFKEKINEFSKNIQVSPKGLQIKKLKNRWGSVTKNKTVVLNVNLVKTPQNIVDYIIIHELCHLRIEGHSYNFWTFLKQYIPDYEKKIDWLYRNSKNIIE